MIDRAPLAPRAKAAASAVFKNLGEAEAAVHGVPIERFTSMRSARVDSNRRYRRSLRRTRLLDVAEVLAVAHQS
jgi:hypothetical protein